MRCDIEERRTRVLKDVYEISRYKITNFLRKEKEEVIRPCGVFMHGLLKAEKSLLNVTKR